MTHFIEAGVREAIERGYIRLEDDERKSPSKGAPRLPRQMFHVGEIASSLCGMRKAYKATSARARYERA